MHAWKDMRRNGTKLSQILEAGQWRSAAFMQYMDKSEMSKAASCHCFCNGTRISCGICLCRTSLTKWPFVSMMTTYSVWKIKLKLVIMLMLIEWTRFPHMPMTVR